MLDVYDWILSPEVRKYLRGNYTPTLLERQALICGAYRPIEEKLPALRELCGQADTEEERALLKKIVEVYQFAVWEIKQLRRDEFYFYRTALQFGGDSGLFAYPFSYLGDAETGICRSYDQLHKLGGGAENCVISSGYTVEKWRRKGEWGPMLRFDWRPVDGAYRATRFRLYDTLMKQADLPCAVWEKYCNSEEYPPFPLPFSTGDLAYIDAPLFERPVHGVLCYWASNHPDYEGERFTLLGYIENGRFRPIDLSGHDIAFDDSGYRVADWVHRVSPEELPTGQEILGEIGAYLQRLYHRDWSDAKNQFLRVFVRSQNKTEYGPYHVSPVLSSELGFQECT